MAVGLITLKKFLGKGLIFGFSNITSFADQKPAAFFVVVFFLVKLGSNDWN